MDNAKLTLAGMFVTILLSVGGTWVTNMVHTGVNDTQITQLIKDNIENKQVNAKVYTMSAQNKHTAQALLKIEADMGYLDMRLDGVEVSAARTTEAIENLAEQIKVLAQTNQDTAKINAANNQKLIIAITKLEK